jgi:hypothetical protein
MVAASNLSLETLWRLLAERGVVGIEVVRRDPTGLEETRPYSSRLDSPLAQDNAVPG